MFGERFIHIMGCICSKGIEGGGEEEDDGIENKKQKELNKSSMQLVAPAPSKRKEEVLKDGSMRYVKVKGVGVVSVPLEDGEKKTKIFIDDSINAQHGHHQNVTKMDRIVSLPQGNEGELIAAGWPQWLTSSAGEAVRGWLPRHAESFEKLEKIGQGTYSSVYRARDLKTNKIVAMKKVRFVNMDPESVRFMAREIHILRRLDHPNVMKIEGIVTSRVSESLYLVFEYMEHDLAGLAATPGIKFTEPQIKCYMQQLLCGLEHCHKRGVLHRDIKGSNLLISDNGVLKIGDFGLATFYQPDQNQALTSRVVTLWYRAPELLLGSTQYGAAIDMWSAGCILAELFAGKPIMPGRTEVEQMHKIFKLCGSPSEEYWKKIKLPDTTSFKPHQSYKRCISETFKSFPSSALALVDRLLSLDPEDRSSATSALRSQFFNTIPLPCHPSTLPKYPPSKELDAKIREKEARRQREDAVKVQHESVRGGSRDLTFPTPEFIPNGQAKTIGTSYKYDFHEDEGSGFHIEPPRGTKQNAFGLHNSMIHPSAVGMSLNKNGGTSFARHNLEFKRQISRMPQGAVDMSFSSIKKEERTFAKESIAVNVARKNMIHYSGPLMPPGGNMDDILKEHERQIQQAVRKARIEKSGTNASLGSYSQPNHQGRHRKG